MTQTLGNRPPHIAYYGQPTSKINITWTETKTTDYPPFTLTRPKTGRQGLRTAVNWLIEQDRDRLEPMNNYPVVYSRYGATAAVTLNQLHEPIPANIVNDTTTVSMTVTSGGEAQVLSQLQEVTTSYPIIFGGTRTTTFGTTVTAEPGDVIFFKFPTLTAPPPVEYTTRVVDTDGESKHYPNGLPILVLTQVEGVVLNSASTTLTTATVVQATPLEFTTDPSTEKVALRDPEHKWSTWSTAERGGVIAAVVLSAFLVMAFLAYLCVMRRRKKKVDEEKNKEEKSKEEKDEAKEKKKGSWSSAFGAVALLFAQLVTKSHDKEQADKAGNSKGGTKKGKGKAAEGEGTAEEDDQRSRGTRMSGAAQPTENHGHPEDTQNSSSKHNSAHVAPPAKRKSRRFASKPKVDPVAQEVDRMVSRAAHYHD
jgi:hypothetical protein